MFDDVFTKKQNEVWSHFATENPKILICSGAKRSGKTYVMTFIFLNHMAIYAGKGLSFILGGATLSSIRRNVLNDIEKLIGKALKFDKYNGISLFGNKLYCFGGENADSWKAVRGFTAAGAYINEATALHDSFIKEIISRCSFEGARVFIDTNPDNPMHTVKTDYINKAGKRLETGVINISHFDFTLFDNTALNKEYIESIIESTPSGMFTDRDIYGRWVTADGIVYKDFDAAKHYISDISKINFEKYIGAVDWGYEHHGALIVLGKDGNGKYYYIYEHVARHEEIDYWVDVSKRVKNSYGNIILWCDSARPEHVQRFRREGIRATNADKSVLSGIEQVARLFKQDKLFVYEPVAKRFKEEIFNYAWKRSADEPLKVNDDCMDALRYAVYNDILDNSVKVRSKRDFGGLL